MFTAPLHDDLDWQVRLAAFAAIRAHTSRNGPVITRDELQFGFAVPGMEARIPFAGRGQGIWRPRILAGNPGAALSLLTSLADPYGDKLTQDGWLEYGFQSGDLHNHYNRALINAYESSRPVIYFRSLETGLFAILEPVFVIDIRPERRIAVLAVDLPWLDAQSLHDHGGPETQKRYATTAALVRLHQDQFRIDVVGAYARKCAVCRLGQTDRLVRLLDAAHILRDGDPRSRPHASNGLALCKIHHSAYDLNIIGIDPDRGIHVRGDILDQVDGPMLQHGIKDMQGGRILVPRNPILRPNPEYLAERFETFRAA